VFQAGYGSGLSCSRILIAINKLKIVPQNSYEAVASESTNPYTAFNTISHQQKQLGHVQTQNISEQTRQQNTILPSVCHDIGAPSVSFACINTRFPQQRPMRSKQL